VNWTNIHGNQAKLPQFHYTNRCKAVHRKKNQEHAKCRTIRAKWIMIQDKQMKLSQYQCTIQCKAVPDKCEHAKCSVMSVGKQMKMKKLSQFQCTNRCDTVSVTHVMATLWKGLVSVTGFIEHSQIVTTSEDHVMFYTLDKSLRDTLGPLCFLQSSTAVAWERFPTADVPLSLGSPSPASATGL
jgi:hypothetical protein